MNHMIHELSLRINMKIMILRTLLLTSALVLFAIHASSQVTVAGSTGANGTYSQLNLAFAAINGTAQAGNNIVVTITASTTETATATLNAGTWTSLNIYPTVTGLSISGNFAAPLIDLNGANNVTLDGRVNATGTSKSLVIENKSTSSTAGTSTIRFINGASSNTLKYSVLKGATVALSGGIIYLSTTTSTGNSNNLIDNNDITNSAGNRPRDVINSWGTSGVTTNNAANIISNNNFYDLINCATGIGSTHIVFDSGSTGCTVKNNSFYETSTVVPAGNGNYYTIYPASGDGYTITGNYIGGTAPLCGGTALTKGNGYNNIFYAIRCFLGTTNQSLIQNNTISNIDWRNTTASDFVAIQFMTGNALIDGNIIGSATGNDKIKLTYGADSPFYGIYNAGSAVVITNNTIGAITLANSSATNATNFYGIYNAATVSSSISNNLIGSTTTANSINGTSASTTSAQIMYGIYSTLAVTINSNTIANLTNGTTNATAATAGGIKGVYLTNSATISGNSIHDLTIANANTSTTSTASVAGIALSGPYTRSVTGNTIYNLSNTYTSFAGCVIGLYYEGTSIANVVSNNFIYGLSVTGATSTSAGIYGIKIALGLTTYSNNVISLGGNSQSTLYGIYETGGGGHNNSLYFNTVSIQGSPTAGTNNSYALMSFTANNIRNIRNNIFNNSRSNSGATGKHYAAYFNYATSANLTLDYNDYYASGTGGVLGYYNAADVNTLPLITALDASSLSKDPQFSVPGSTTAVDYKPGYLKLFGVTGTGITTDYAGVTRVATPTIGAFEVALNYNVEMWKAGTLQKGYVLLKNAFDDINTGTYTGALDIKIKGSTTELASAVLNASGSGSASYSAINIYPTASGLSVSGNLAAPLIDFNGADNVTVDGRVNATGSVNDLTFLNNSTAGTTGTSTFRFKADASNNVLQYSNIKGSTRDGNGGVVFFSTGTTTGNINNTVSNNNFTNAGGNCPSNSIYSISLTAATSNKNITISDNKFYDFLSTTATSNGINVGSYSYSWTISGNSFYQTTPFAPTAPVSYYIIYVSGGTGTNRIIIANNYIGGSQPLCGGIWNKTTTTDDIFTGIIIAGSTTGGAALANTVQGNSISNFNWNNTTANWNGIYLTVGYANITGNTIGSITAPNSITINNSGNNGMVTGILNNSGMVTCNNNIISSISLLNTNSTYSTSFQGIRNNSSLLVGEIKNNTIGNENSTYGISCQSKSTASFQALYGIYNAPAGLSNTNVLNNTIANLSNLSESSSSGYMFGIYNNNTSGITVSNNNIHHLSIANSRAVDVVIGIYLDNSTTYPNTVIGNNIYNLSLTSPAAVGGGVGITFSGPTAGGNRVSQNYIHDLSAPLSSTAATLCGIKTQYGTNTCDNNVINLGGNTQTTLYGIYDGCSGSDVNAVYFNTVYIGGSPSIGGLNSSALYRAYASDAPIYKNNIFANVRSNGGAATGKHYAIQCSATGGSFVANNNDYYVTGSGGMLAYYGANLNTLAALQAANANDGQSITVNPLFANSGGILPTDYIPASTKLFGAPRLSVTTDYVGTVRKSYPSMGAFEVLLDYNVELWKGGIQQSGYGKLKDAVDEINAGFFTDDLELKIKNSTIETATAVFNATGSGSTNYTSINMYPTSTGLSITGDLAAPLIDLNGATNVTIDGRVNATGSIKDLTITNQSVSALAGTSTVRFINDATSNTLKYCNVKGSTLDATGGVILFSTANATGNNSNTIDNNTITNSLDGNRPICVVWSEGTSGLDNSGNTISNNIIYDFFNRGIDSKGIYIGANTSNCAVTANSFYETTTFVPTASVAYYPIYINNPLGTGFNVSGNSIGGQAAACGGLAWTKTNALSNAFNGIYLNVGTSDITNAQNNTIKNISWSNASNSPWLGINIAGGKVDTNGLYIKRGN